MHVNTTSCFLAIKYAAPAMLITSTEKKKEDVGGSIIMTASGAPCIFIRISSLVLAIVPWPWVSGLVHRSAPTRWIGTSSSRAIPPYHFLVVLTFDDLIQWPEYALGLDLSTVS